MKVQFLYFEGCPTYTEAEQVLREVLAEEGIDAEVELMALTTEEYAQRLRFPGSPTFRLNGVDLFPTLRLSEFGLMCRTYMTPEGLRGTPTAAMLRNALSSVVPRSRPPDLF